MRPPEPDPLPLRVDVISGWPLMAFIHDLYLDVSNMILARNSGLGGTFDGKTL